MENIKKIKLLDYIKDGSRYSVYSDRFGFCANLCISAISRVKCDDEWCDTNQIFYKKAVEGNVVYKNISELYYEEMIDVFSMPLYKSKLVRKDYYGRISYDTPQKPDDTKQIAISAVEVQFSKRNGYYSNDMSVEFTKQTIKNLNHKIYIIDDIHSQQKNVNFSLLKVGDLVCCDGTCKIAEVFEPNREQKLFRAVSIFDGHEVNILENSNVYQVPYEQYTNEFTQFDEMLNESKLRPYIDSNVVFWLPIDDACQYVVSIYTVFAKNDSKSQKLYHLQDVYVERNKHFLVLDKELANKVIVRVSAENRAGEIIAHSRGINGTGKPCFWTEK